MNTLLNYPGAKWGMAKEIISLMPKHRSYLEPFFGSGAVLFNKPPSAIETVNDIDGDIVNFFRVLREKPDELAEAISLTPYARAVFDDAHENRGTDEFDRAYRFAIRSKMGHGFKTYQKTGFKIDVYARERSYCVGCWNRLPGDLLEAAKRLKDVQIENKPALDLIRKFNHDNVLIYADPPYLLNTRGGKQYRHEMTEQDHVELLDALKQHKKDKHGSWGTVYVLVNFDTTMAENLFRIYKLRDMGFDPFVMVFDKPHAPKEILRLQRWCNNKRIFKSCPRFEDYKATRYDGANCAACVLEWLKQPAEVENAGRE